jgi:hypothetical protein
LSVAGEPSLLHPFAQVYLELGYAVIPVQNSKIPAVEWKPYQHRRPTQADLQRWFIQGQYPGIGIITGAISNLVVLDFDDPALFQQFKTRYSDLAQTRTVQTRRGFHLYFHLPPHVRIASRKIAGIDLLSDGRYVVAPPSIINDHTYKVSCGGHPRALTPQDSTRITSFLDSLAGKSVASSKRPYRKIQWVFPDKNAAQPSLKPLAANDLIGLYRYLAPREGRNEALFKASLRARDSGWTDDATIRALTDIHVQQHPNQAHKAETSEQRHREAERTIYSAFSRPPRPITQHEPAQLPNTVREALFKRQQTYLVRVIEGLRLKGIQPGMWFTEAQARELLAEVVGKHSIRESLIASLNDEIQVFGTNKTPSGLPLTPNGVAKQPKQHSISKCLEIIPSKSELIRRGRPTHYYQMPGNTELAAQLGVKLTRISDPLTENDLQSARKTRQAAHREYIRRRPGQYPARWLAYRLGISVITEQRYNQDIPINVKPMYTEIPIFWWNLGHVPDDIDVPGLFLLDDRGKRYPARTVIARKLLSQRHQVSLMRRACNYYSYGTYVLPAVVPVREEQQTLIRKPEAIYVKLRQTRTGGQGGNPPQPVNPPPGSRTTPGAAKPDKPKHARKVRFSKRKYRKPLEMAEKEALAQRVYTRTGNLSPDNRLSEFMARRLVDQYDSRLVEQALRRVGRDSRIYNPAGFLVSYLRSESKARTQSPTPVKL